MHPSTSFLASWRRHEARPPSSLPRRWRGPTPPLLDRILAVWHFAASRRARGRLPRHERRPPTPSGQRLLLRHFLRVLRPRPFPGRDRRTVATDHARQHRRPSPRWSRAPRRPCRRHLDPSGRLAARTKGLETSFPRDKCPTRVLNARAPRSCISKDHSSMVFPPTR